MEKRVFEKMFCFFILFYIKQMSYQPNNRYSQNSNEVNTTQRSIPFDAVVGEKMGQRQTLNRPQTPIKNLPPGDRNTISTPYRQQQRQVIQPEGYTQIIPIPYGQPAQTQYQRIQPGGYTQTIPISYGQQAQTQYQKKIEQYVDGPNPPPPQRRVEYVPYQQKYIDYVEQKQWVPVQRAFTDYYQIQHIVDYVPVEKEDYVMVTQPKETVDYKIEYVPVEQKIIHLTEANARIFGYNMNDRNLVFNQNKDLTHTFQGERYVVENQTPINYVQTGYKSYQVNEFQPRKSRTNFVTTEGYDANTNLRNIDKILSQSAARGSHANSRVVM